MSEDSPPYLLVFCLFSILAWAFELYLSLRQRLRLINSKSPHELINLSQVEFRDDVWITAFFDRR